MNQDFLVVGGGVAGLFAAALLKRKHADRNVIVLEQAPKPGGLLQSFDYGEHGCFDIGVHTFYETGNADIDGFFQSVLPEEDWTYLTDFGRDMGGSWREGVLQYNTGYPDLTKLSRAEKAEYISDFFGNLTPATSHADDTDVMSYATQRYGPKIAEEVVRPAIEASQMIPAEQVHWLAAAIQRMDRVALLPTDAIDVLVQSPLFSGQLAFPNQLDYPEKYLPGKRAFYPRKFGMGRYIDALVAQLEDSGIEILTSARLTELLSSDGRSTHANITLKDGSTRQIATDHVYWAASMPALAATLKLDMGSYRFDPPNQTVTCNLLTEKEPYSGGVFYATYLGHERIRRLSFADNYCADARPNGSYPICVELTYPMGEDVEGVEAKVEGWLRDDGVIQPDNKVVFSKAEVLGTGYPCLSCKNISSMGAMRRDILASDLTNLTPIGILSNENLFFQYDIIVHIHRLITQ
jgi:protoporphyrinogen oxidase